MRVYPAIDIRGGRCVRLLQGRADAETEYFDDPGKAARLWKQAGSEWVHAVDLDGAFSGEPLNWESIGRIAGTGLKVQMGGGIRSRETIERAFNCGVQRVVVGTRACEDEEFLAGMVAEFGDRIAVGIDAKGGKAAVKGWVAETDLDALDLARRVVDRGVETIVYTDISTDGTLTGPNFTAQREMLSAVPCRVIASGGVARREDVERFCQLSEEFPNLEGVIIGKALYEGKVDLADLNELAGAK